MVKLFSSFLATYSFTTNFYLFLFHFVSKRRELRENVSKMEQIKTRNLRSFSEYFNMNFFLAVSLLHNKNSRIKFISVSVEKLREKKRWKQKKKNSLQSETEKVYVFQSIK